MSTRIPSSDFFFFFFKEEEQRNGMVARREGRAKSFSSTLGEMIVRLYVYGKEWRGKLML